MAKQKLSKEEKKKLRKEQKQKDALRSYRFRGLKNFLFWLSGMLTCLILIVSALFVGLKVIPIGTYLGSSANGYVSEDVSSKSIIDAFLKANTYDMSDFPVVADALDELIKGANLDEFVEIDVERIKTLKFDGDFATNLQSCVKVVATLDSVGGADLLGDIGKLDVFSTWAEVDADNMPIDEDNDGVIDKDGGGEFSSNPKLYYYLKTSEPALLAAKMSSEGEYVRAFDDNGRYVDGYEGEKLYLANLSKVPILDIVDLIDESFGRLKLTNLLETFGGSELDASIIGNILGDKTISQMGNITGDSILIKDFLGEPTSENQQMYDILCAIVKTDGEEKPLPEELSLGHLQGGIDFEGIKIEIFGLDSSTTKILFDAVNGKLEATGGTRLTELSELTVSHLTTLDPNYIKLFSVLPYKDAEKGIDNSNMYRIILQACGHSLVRLEDAEVEELASKLAINSFNDVDFNNVSIETFGLDEATLTLLLDAVNGKISEENELLPDNQKKDLLTITEQLTVGHLISLDTNYITLCSILPYKDAETGVDNSQLYKIILQACGHKIEGLDDSEIEELASGLGINAFSKFNEQNITLNTILPVDATDDDGNYVNKSLYDILLDMVNSGKADADKKDAIEITLSDLSSFKTDSIRLSTILPLTQEVDGKTIEANKDLYNILSDIVNAPGATTIIAKEDITIEHLSNNFVYSNIRLNTVLKIENNGALYDILNDIINEGKTSGDGYVSKTDFTIASLSGFDYSKIRLNTVMPNTTTNEGLYKILLDVVNSGEISVREDQLTVGHLSNFNYNKMHLSTILDTEKNQDLYKVLLDVINGQNGTLTEDDITLTHLSQFNVADLHLKTVMTNCDNNILQKLIDQNATIGGLATAIDKLSLYDIYGQNCFKKDSASDKTKYSYDASTKTYTLDANGEYVISDKSGIWLFLCFDSEGISQTNENNAKGCAKKYIVSDATLKTLSDPDSGADISSKITNATIRQLIDAGILKQAVQSIYANTLQQVANGQVNLLG